MTFEQHENSDDALAPELDELTYEQARDELIQVIARLESGGVALEESISLWERGEALAQHCEDLLEGAQERLDMARGADEPSPIPAESSGFGGSGLGGGSLGWG